MKKWISLMLCLLLMFSAAVSLADVGLDTASRSNQEIQNFLASHPIALPDEIYEAAPVLKAPFSPGKLNAQTIQAALNAVNQVRFVAGLNGDVTENPDYSAAAQAGAMVNAVNQKMDHHPTQPAGMSQELFDLAYKGTSESNIAYGYGNLIRALFEGWMHDGDSNNIARLGHRGWILNPAMKATGFGHAGNQMAMYALDFGGKINVRFVAWPAPKMPASWMSGSLPWGLSIYGPYLGKDNIHVSLVRRSDGKTWNFSAGASDGYFGVYEGGSFSGNRIIFRPNNIKYSLGDHYDVTITGAVWETVRYSVELYKFDSAESFVARCYEVILNRTGESEGIVGWADALRKKTQSASEIIYSFIQSQEFINRSLTDAESVEVLYKAMLNRDADAAGKASWVEALEEGYSLAHLINGFCGSVEFKALCSQYGIEPGSVEAPPVVNKKIKAFVSRCYSLILNREADPAGLNAWGAVLAARTAPAAQIIDGFVRSPEYINRNLSAEASVDILYRTMLNREADAAGKAGWVDALGKGYTFQHIINGFCGSAEFTGLCAEYGIEPGSIANVKAAAEEAAAALPDERIGNAVSADEAGQTAVNGYEPEEVEAFVKHAYRAALSREADEAGLASWTEQIVSGAVTPKAFLRSLLFSDEQIARQLNNEQYIDMLYHLYLKRGADEAAAGWIDVLVTAGHDEVIRGFESSAEFRVVLAGFGL